MRQPKEAVDYSAGHKDSHCGRISKDDQDFCAHFRPPTPRMDEKFESTGTCRKVIGTIKRTYWCKLYEKTDAA